MISLFSEENKRLKDPSPLNKFKALYDNFFQIYNKLGTLEHEVALNLLKIEVRASRKDFWCAIKTTWGNFWRHKRMAKEMYDSLNELDIAQREAQKLLKVDQDNPQNYTFKKIVAPFLFLSIELKAIFIYINYYSKLLLFFITKHVFIISTSIIVAGILYSEATESLSTKIDHLFKTNLPIGFIVVVISYFINHYYIGPKIKQKLVKLERKWLREISFHLLLVRSMALYHRTNMKKYNG